MRLYLIRCEETDRVKIGISEDCGRRLKQHQCGSPTRLHLEVTWPVPKDEASRLEALMHRLCKHYHLHGEWYEPEAACIVRRAMKV
jgi:predicted GIY-YIG superfamily endonuclease